MPERVLALIVAVAASSAVAADTLRDPTKPTRPATESVEAPASALRVSAVFVSGERRVAIVNGRRVHEGDVVAGATVTRIETKKVSFVRNGAAIAVPLLNGSTRD